MDGNKLCTGKSEGHMPSGSKDRLIVVGRQTKYLQFTKLLKFDNFNSEAHLGCLNGSKVPIASYQ